LTHTTCIPKYLGIQNRSNF